jgi:hypothetical protein
MQTETNTAENAVMSVSDMFKEFVSNLAIENIETISLRYGEITSALNKRFRDTESKTANTLQVGSFGRKTGINGISDLDMLYVLPKWRWAEYEKGGQLKLLQDTKAAILDRYPKTKVRVDRLVVTVTYANFHVEVQPVFEQDDGSYKYPDTRGEGSWKITKPREEMAAMSEVDKLKNSNLRRLCKMARAWRNKHGVGMGGLLIDTLAHKFLCTTEEYDSRSFLYYDWMSRDFFKFLSELPKQDYFSALGSGQRVSVKKNFQQKAKKAYELALKAIEADGTEGANLKWKRIYGRPFPVSASEKKKAAAVLSTASWRNTEEFIEDSYPVDIRYSITIDCDVRQNGFRESTLASMIANRVSLRANKSLRFFVAGHNLPQAFDLKWKVLNRGAIAQKKDCVRGQIDSDRGYLEKRETTNFQGDHVVECYAIIDDVVVATDRIHVPISTTET